MIPRLRRVRAQRMTIVNAMLAFVVLIVSLQLWLLTATMNAYLGGDATVVLPASQAGGGGLGVRRPRGWWPIRSRGGWAPSTRLVRFQ